ncbi:MAG: hypothetical protein ATN33_03145 [Epulopiscium sp. Nele67-Bin001]|nr:MAG: hypothetical protein ATN33_03145 [Epulopiscium sp. Nele67-Bin001]
MKNAGYEIKQGKHIAFKSSEQKKFIRLRLLGDEYSEAFIQDVIDGKQVNTVRPSKELPTSRKCYTLAMFTKIVRVWII